MALSQAYKEGFGDGWSDARAGRDTESVIHGHEQQTGNAYRSQYATGYREGARAFGKRLEGRFAPSRRQDPKKCPHQMATQRWAGRSYICDACGAEVA